MRTEVARERVEGALLGCALGDALGLPMEGLTSRQIAADFEPLDRFRLVGRRGFVSDDTDPPARIGRRTDHWRCAAALVLGGCHGAQLGALSSDSGPRFLAPTAAATQLRARAKSGRFSLVQFACWVVRNCAPPIGFVAPLRERSCQAIFTRVLTSRAGFKPTPLPSETAARTD